MGFSDIGCDLEVAGYKRGKFQPGSLVLGLYYVWKMFSLCSCIENRA